MPKKSDESLDTIWVTTFLTVADHHSFVAAAQILGCSQGTVSSRIAKLEGWVGAELVTRSQHHSLLTNIGCLFYSEAVEFLARLERFKSILPTLDKTASWAADMVRLHLARNMPDAAPPKPVEIATARRRRKKPGAGNTVILPQRQEQRED